MIQEKQFKREPARKASVSELLGESFVEGEAMVRRVNILATVVDKSQVDERAYKSVIVDDGTDQVQLRFFGSEGTEGDLFGKVEVGNFSVIIGKLRKYGDSVYVSPEIIKKLGDVKWADFRRLELRARGGAKAVTSKPAALPKIEKDVVNRDKMEIYTIVKQLDGGRGADLLEVAAKAANPNADLIIREMVKAGDLFEVLPGKLKVLE